jgi:hypothetical protein
MPGHDVQPGARVPREPPGSRRVHLPSELRTRHAPGLRLRRRHVQQRVRARPSRVHRPDPRRRAVRRRVQ